MAGKRRVFGAAFEAKVALAAAKGDRTTAQLASQFGIHLVKARPEIFNTNKELSSRQRPSRADWKRVV